MYIVIRVRGRTKINTDTADALKILRLTRINHAVLLKKNKENEGMLRKVNDYVTWGEIDKETLKELITKKGRLIGDKAVTDEYIKENTSYQSIDELTTALIERKIVYGEIPEIKPLFRLSPPKGGYGKTKRSHKEGGALGYQGKEINNLVKNMIIYR
ncbi:MAG: 50S ribosomal protein L30 [Thermoplasmata archaeon]